MDSTALPVPFAPMDLGDLASLSSFTLNAMAWDFALAGDTHRLAGLLPLEPFSAVSLGTSGRGPQRGTDYGLVGAALFAVDDSLVGAVLEAAQSARAKSAETLSNGRGVPNDLGPLFAFLCMKAARLAIEELPEDAERCAWRAAALAASALPTDGQLASVPNYASFYGQPQAVGVGAGELANDSAFLEDGRSLGRPFRNASWTPFHAAMLAAKHGFSEPLAAWVERCPGAVPFAAMFESDAAFRDGHGGLTSALSSALRDPSFWMANAHVGAVLLERADRLRAAAGKGPAPIPPSLGTAMAKASQNDPAHPALAALRARQGDELFANLATDSNTAADAFARALALSHADPSLLPALGRLCHALADPSSPRPIHFSHVLAMLHQAFLSPIPGAAEAAMEACRAARPSEDCFAEAAASLGAHKHLRAAASCPRPDRAHAALAAMDPAALSAYPAGRRGLDHSALMVFAEHATLPVFEAALDWFAGRGLLAEQAQARAWVYAGHETRKKGDLLARCVALGKTDFAQALLARLPALDTKSSREVAKAMAAKVHSGAGGAALSSWESLLFNRMGALAPSGPSAEPSAAPRRARSL